MAGFGLDGYLDRVPCPHCGSTDCAGYRIDSLNRAYLICCDTNKTVSEKALTASAEKNGLVRVSILVRGAKNG